MSSTVRPRSVCRVVCCVDLSFGDASGWPVHNQTTVWGTYYFGNLKARKRYVFDDSGFIVRLQLRP